MKRQTKHIVFGLLFTVMVGAGLIIQAQTPCPAQPTCAPVVQTQPVCAPVVQAPQPVNCPAQPACAPVIAAPACCGGEEFDDLLESIEENADSFRSHIPKSLDECVINSCARGTFLNQYVADFEVATDRLEHNFKHDSLTTADAQEVLDRAAYIDSFMSSHNVSGKAASDWSELRADLDKLASCQNVATRWGDPAYAWNKQSNRLTGTYRLDPSRSDNVNTALTTISQTQCGCQQQVSYLDTPEMLAIDQNGQCVTIASSTGRQVAVVADGQLVPDATRGVSTQSTLQEGDALFIRTYSERERNRNYTATFTPIDDGIRVTRYVDTGDPAKPLVINSVYTRTSDVAQLNLYDSGASSMQRQVVYSGNFVVPNGTSLTASLDSAFDTSLAREGDRFTMTVSSPSEYNGAVIEGFISDIGGAGRAALNFERIRLSDGRVYDFAAEIISASAADGSAVNVSSGAWITEQERQAQQNLARTSQSAAIGAVVGTVPVSGSGTGVNTIFAPAGGALKLGDGTEFVLRAASPRTI